MTMLQAVIAFLWIYRFPVVLVTSLCQSVWMWRQHRKLRLYVRWYRSQQQAYYQSQQQYRQW